ncbi:DUF6230 family protein [Schumannella sp. 10F1B-5-1]|uniref:DUF6230 family protein n=1 Tax=Schumannella sp. 10F1B-5-1 TaxID=2590780 RepID=UPI0011323B6C|nr:DUF6230 family protein [Schumannella sp. 10F1B-5-1]TPW70104.1 cholesterol esterase [Schumannella sp. 10F1B-5-1]
MPFRPSFRRPQLRRDSLKKVTRSHAGRIALVSVPVAVIASITLGGVAQGAVPVSFAISGSQFKISASQLEGTGFSQYAGTAKDTEGTEHPVAIANIKQATLANLCQSVATDTPLGKVGVRITAGGGETPASATDLQIGMTDLKGDTSFGNVRIGIDASQVKTDAKGTAGDFAQDSDTISIKNLQQVSWTTQASVFTLTGMHVELSDQECF